ncbi:MULTISPECIES: alkaline phosphatase family protein [Chitinophagaceae]
MIKKFFFHSLVVLLVIATGTSCKKYPDSPPIFEPYDSVVPPPDRRILVIGIDGLNSNAFQTVATPNYTALLQHGKYAWDAKSDVISKDASAWKTLTSGVTYSTHHISDSSFLQDSASVVPDIEDFQQAQNYPSVFGFLIRSKLYNTPTAVLSSWSKMVTSTMPEVPAQYILPNDAAVKDSTVSLLKSGDSKVIMVHFNTPARIAVDPSDPTAAFSASSAPYAAALKTVDGYIGDIMTALKARPNYNQSEQWLVVVTGTHGGVNKTYGGTSDDETNVPILYYNENFVKQEFTKQGGYAAVTLQGNYTSANFTNATINNLPAFNPGTGDYTIQLRVKGTANNYYPHFFSKTKNWTASRPAGGWTFFTASGDGQWKFSLTSESGSERRFQATTPQVFDGSSWHTLTVVLYDSAVSGVTKRWVKRFTDGVRVDEGTTSRDISIFGNIANTVPLILGYGGDDGTYGGKDNPNPLALQVADVALLRTALSDAEVTTNLCSSSSIATNPKTVAFWPCNDGIGGIFHNGVAADADFTLNGTFKWTTLSEYPCSFSPTPPAGKTTLFLTNVDISVQMFYWLGLSVPSAWAAEGNVWLDQYENEFYKK